MLRIIYVSLATVLISFKALAQMPYTFTAFNQAYVPLDSATKIDSGVVWDNSYYFSAPVGFPFKIDTMHCPYFFSQAGSVCQTDTMNVTISGFIMNFASLDDRGYTLDTVSHSPVRYKVIGPVGNRIFKFEIFNAGFDQQLQDAGVMTDSVNMQMWYYEDSNAVEMRYGPSLITSSTYFNPLNFAGYLQDVDTSGKGILWSLNGNPAHPTIKKVPLVGGNPTTTFTGLTGYPPSGTVYRFAYNKALTGIEGMNEAENVTVYPTISSSEITVKYTGSEQLNYDVIAVSGAHMPLNGLVSKGLNQIDISSLPDGMYLLQLHGNAGSKVYKFVKI